MRFAGNTRNRPEQLLAKLIIEKILGYQIESEYFVKDLKPVGEKDFSKTNQIPTLDLAIPDRKIAIRLQGPYHDELKQIRKDRIQKFVLEGNGWIVIDFVHTDMPVLFQKRLPLQMTNYIDLMKIVAGIHSKLLESGVIANSKLTIRI